MSYTYIKTNLQNGIFSITLNRPQKHNALNADMVKELIQSMGVVADTSTARVVVLQGEGPSFCAGADLNFVEKAHGTPELPAFGELIQELLFELVHCRLPVITIAKGSVYGGALGLLAASDIVVSAEDCCFSFSETKVGMVPAAILPFVNKRIGTTNTRYLMLTAMTFGPNEALSAGLVNKIAIGQLPEEVAEEIIRGIMLSSAEATIFTKQIINAIDNRNVLIDSASYSIHFYDDINKSDSVKEGLKAFREKRKPNWVQSNENFEE